MDRETIQFIKLLKDYRGKIPRQKIKTLRGQALAGDLLGARLGLKKIPKIKELNEKYASLISEKRKEYANYKTVKAEMQAYVIARRNLEELLKHEQPQKKREQTIIERK